MITEIFTARFGRASDKSGFTPGRVNLIGEHIDYNGGRVLPTALDLGVSIALASRNDGIVRIASDGFDDLAERSISDPASGHWSDYLVGAAQLAKANGFGPNGADIAVATTLPFGAGISSSAAVTVGLLRAFRDLRGSLQTDTDLAVLARQVENDYIGMPCGIMDQMAVAIARPGQALFLDTTSLDFDCIDLPETHHIVVVHSGVFRELAEGHYRIRKEECDAVKALIGRDDICLMSDAELTRCEAELPARVFRRARHCVSEHRRTVAAAQALQSGDIATLGALMNQSHISMRDDFEMSVPAVDALVADAQKLGAVGARLTGGGFGGCIVACVDKADVPDWRSALLTRHPDAFWVA